MPTSPDRHPAVSFRVSSFCTDRGCVGVGLDGDDVVIVDTKADGSSLRLTRGEWAAFTSRIRTGELSLG